MADNKEEGNKKSNIVKIGIFAGAGLVLLGIGLGIGALIFGIVKQGIIFAGVDADWFQVFMGVMLVSAVLVNGRFKKKYIHEF